MKGSTLAEQHKRSVTDLLKASVWRLLSTGETEASRWITPGKRKKEEVKVAEEKVMPC